MLSRLHRSTLLAFAIVAAVILSGMTGIVGAPAHAAELTEPDTPAVIVGSLATPEGDPIADARVAAVPAGGEDDPQSWVTTYTDLDGSQYSENHQSEGSYRLLVPAGSYKIRIQLDLEEDASWWSDQAVVTVAAGDYEEVGRTTLYPVETLTSSISGAVVDAADASLVESEVSLYRHFEGRGWRWSDSASTDEEGGFDFGAVRRGARVIVCVYGESDLYCDGRPFGDLAASDGFVVGEDETQALPNAVVMPEVTVRVPILHEGGSVAANQFVTLTGPSGDVSYAQTDDSGTAIFSGVLPGAGYTVCAWDVDGRRCLGGSDNYEDADKLPITPTSTTTVALDAVILFAAVGTVSGIVATEAGEGVAGVQVALVRRDSEFSSSQVDRDTTGSDGTFLLDGAIGDDQYAVCVLGFLGDAGQRCTSLTGGDPHSLGSAELTYFSLKSSAVELDGPIRVPAPVAVVGSVQHDGTGVADRSVSVVTLADNWSGATSYVPAMTDVDGNYSAVLFGEGRFTACVWDGNDDVCLGGAPDISSAQTVQVAGDQAEVTVPALEVAGPEFGCGAVLDNETVELGLGCEGTLGMWDNESSAKVGLRASGAPDDGAGDAVAFGCLCEGWGVGDAVTGTRGFVTANEGRRGVEGQSFTRGSGDVPRAASTVDVADGTFAVSHEVEPSEVSDNAYVVRVSVTNTSEATVQLRYRRTVDFDLAPQPTVEYLTMSGSAPEVAFRSNDGFASPDPFSPRSSLGASGPVENHGPKDQGSLLDLDFGALESGQTRTFTLAYGLAPSAEDAEATLDQLSPAAYALAIGTAGETADGQAAFLAYDIEEEPSGAPRTTADEVRVVEGEVAFVDVLDNDTDPAGGELSLQSNTQPRHGFVSCQSNGLCTYHNDGEGAGADSFSYVVRNAAGRTATGTVRITVIPIETEEPTNLTPPVLTDTTGDDSVIVSNDRLEVVDGTWDQPIVSRDYEWYVSFNGFTGGDQGQVFQSQTDSYVVNSWYQGASFRVVEVARTASGAEFRATSNILGPVRRERTILSERYPSLGDTPVAGQAVSAPEFGWYAVNEIGQIADGVSIAVRYEWVIGEEVVSTAPSYTPVGADVGRHLAVRIIAESDGYLRGFVELPAGKVLPASTTFRTVAIAVTDDAGDALAGAWGSVCGRHGCFTGQTDDDGVYRVRVRSTSVSEPYQVHVSADPKHMTHAGTVRIASGEGVIDYPVTLNRIVIVQPSSAVTFADDSRTTGADEDEVPAGTIGTEMSITVTGCEGVADPTVTLVYANGSTRDLNMSESPAGTYAAALPLDSPGYAQVRTNVVPCDGTDPVGFTVFIDPSGVVTDQYGRPVDGATITLLKLGAAGFAAVADGDTTVMDEQVNINNPSVTGADLSNGESVASGFFRWDVVEGTYQVSVAAGATSHGGTCGAAATSPMKVPPARLDLLVKIVCAGATPPTPTTAPVLSGTAQVGQVLSISEGVWDGGLVYEGTEWLRDGDVVGTDATYTLTAADLGKQVTARLTARRPSYVQENGTGSIVDFAAVTYERSSAVVTAASSGGGGGGGGGGTPSVPKNTASPTVIGAAKVGATLVANPGSWDADGLSFAYQWLRDGSPVAGATGVTYTVVPADLGSEIGVEVTASKTGLSQASAASSTVTIALGDAPEVLSPPVVTGEAVVGGVLNVSDGSWDTAGLTFSRQWLRDGVPIIGETGISYTVTAADAGTRVGAVVTAAREGYADGSAGAAAVVVPVGPDEPEQVTSTTTATLKREKVKAGKRANLVVIVARSDGETASGQVRIVVDGIVVRAADLNARGRAVVSLPKLAAGVHKVRATYAGGESVDGSRSPAARLVVTKAKKGKGHRPRLLTPTILRSPFGLGLF